ncbi:hypothetical protein EEB14_33350 [Rhodococcus sp. WS4]|nr:hypothetical protein EEB14_33350 [Rhodococcus sp. WS4]
MTTPNSSGAEICIDTAAAASMRATDLDEINTKLGELHDRAAALNSNGLYGDTADAFRAKQSQIAAQLESLKIAAQTIADVSRQHDDSVAVYRASSPTDAELTTAREEHERATAMMSLHGLNKVYILQADAAEQSLTTMVAKRRAAVETFKATQEGLRPRAENIELQAPVPINLKSAESPRVGAGSAGVSGPAASGVGATAGAGAGAGGGGLPSGSGSVPSSLSAASGASNSSSWGSSKNKPSLNDLLAGGTTTPHATMLSASPWSPGMMPMVGTGAMGGIPGYGMPIAGTTMPSAAAVTQGTRKMSDSKFQKMLDQIKSGRSASGTDSAPASAFAAGGFAPSSTAGTAPSGQAAQPASWVNAATAQTGESAGQARATGSAAGPAYAPPGARGGGMPMAPMAPMNPAAGGQGRGDKADRPKIKNADPTVYGDDVQVTTPVVGNRKGLA